jgi:hypothetical protein
LAQLLETLSPFCFFDGMELQFPLLHVNATLSAFHQTSPWQPPMSVFSGHCMLEGFGGMWAPLPAVAALCAMVLLHDSDQHMSSASPA